MSCSISSIGRQWITLYDDSHLPEYSSCKRGNFPLSNIEFIYNGVAGDCIMDKYSGIYVEMGEKEDTAQRLFGMLQIVQNPESVHGSSTIIEIFKINATDWEKISKISKGSNNISSELFRNIQYDSRNRIFWSNFKKKFLSGRSNFLRDTNQNLTNEQVFLKYEVSEVETLYHDAIKRFNFEMKHSKASTRIFPSPSGDPICLNNVISNSFQLFTKKPKTDFLSKSWRILCLQLEEFVKEGIFRNDSCDIDKYERSIVNAAVIYFNLLHREFYFGGSLPKDFETFYNTSVVADHISRGTFHSSLPSRKRKVSNLWNLLYKLLRSGAYDLGAKLTKFLKSNYQCMERYFVCLNEGNTFKDFRIFSTLNNKFLSKESETDNVYKMLIFCLLLDKDFPINPYINFDFEDYTWYEVMRLKIHGKRSLFEMRKKLDEIFENSNMFTKMKEVLCEYKLVTGCYFDFLNTCASIQEMKVHVIHFALFLYLSKIVDINSVPRVLAEEISVAKQKKIFPLENYFYEYIVKVATINVQVAVDYIYLFRDLNSYLVKKCFMDITDLTSNISIIFGNYYINGVKSDALIDNYSFNVHDIVKYIAENKEKNGEFYHALRFYDLSRNYTKVVELLNLLICESLACDMQDDFRKSVNSLAFNVNKRLQMEKWKVPIKERNTLEFFLVFIELHYLIKQFMWKEAYELILLCQFIPKANSEILSTKDMTFSLSNIINSCIPGFLLNVMNVYQQLDCTAMNDKISYNIRIHAKVLLDYASNFSEIYIPKKFIQELLDVYDNIQ